MPANVILSKMLDRLFASMARGPCLNCRPHASRQRLDVSLLSRLKDIEPAEAMLDLLGGRRAATIAGRVPAPPEIRNAADRAAISTALEIIEQAMYEDETAAVDSVEPPRVGEPASTESGASGASETSRRGDDETDPSRVAWLQQRSLLTKLRNLSDDARTYEQDTGVAALHIGYPLLSLPPGFARAASSRVLAPIAFIPVSLTVRTGHKPGVDVACRGEGVDRVMPNAALMAWLERQTGQSAEEVFIEDEGQKPWEEIAALIRKVCAMLDLALIERKDGEAGGIEGAPEAQVQGQDRDQDRDQAHAAAAMDGCVDLALLVDPQRMTLSAAPRTEDLPAKPAVLNCAVIGLYPMAHESLLRDTQAMIDEPALDGPVMSFIDARVRLEAPPAPALTADASEGDAETKVERSPRRFADERLVAQADPCQSRTVAMARQARGLVVHGPPGTGKSQTITNIIGDHLSRGERVLFVCDKRTALDVVANRLEHLGLSGLCGVVHDPQRDQRDLYMAIRAQLDGLAEANTKERAERELEKIDQELQRLHDELTEVHAALMSPPAASAPSTLGGEYGQSFHDLMGEWLAIPSGQQAAVVETELAQATPPDVEGARRDIEVILRRGQSIGYPDNTWVSCAGVTLEQYLARPAAEMRRALASSLEDARAADATRHESIPPFNLRQPLGEQARLRQEMAATLREIVARVEPAMAKRIAVLPAEDVARVRQQLREAEASLKILRQGGALDSELAIIARDAGASVSSIAGQLGAVEEYLASARKWHALLHFGARSRAAKALRPYGLPVNVDAAERLRKFLVGLRARHVLSQIARRWQDGTDSSAAGVAGQPLPDEHLTTTFQQHELLIAALEPAIGMTELEAPLRTALTDFTKALGLLDGLDRSPQRAATIEQLEASLTALNLLDAAWLKQACEQVRGGRKAAEAIGRLQEQFDSLEGVLRIRNDLARVHEAFCKSIEGLLQASADPEEGFAAVRRGVLQGEISRRLANNRTLAQIDSERIAATFERYRTREAQKRGVVRDVILHRWRSKQKERLLAATGSRLNSEGAQMRQRLFVRGARAMRLRQVIAVGREGRGENETDPLFDLCPVWLASPETVAQVFPRRPLFDVVVFDEASQCKLEEALPVLTRAKRVVIAGDPKQLPPTRFFEASISESDDTALETDQDLFEAQQGEIEDLLAAALNLEIEESYLDVHYRSRNADLIEFSNQQFYHDRLQPIPGHPANRTPFAPITLYRVDGTYDRRCNMTEAKRVCEIVRDLLKRAEPPSIGIACFNLTQRDLIAEMLDDLAVEDGGFAKRLETARERRGEASFEGLFVKNLENVQGDERDHMIISTTYGRNEEGKFYRRFGPLGMPGGGRRLNVLVTRARHEVHLVTSVPREAYMHAERVPEGFTPNGGWLLFAYLRYAEELAGLYETNHRILSEAQAAPEARVIERPIEPFSSFALAVAQQLAQAQQIGSDVHWGNAGFRVDVALHHPRRTEDVTVGLLCDFARYARAQDAVEWDVFRSTMHESQGWRLHRVWSPQYFRDATRTVNAIMRDVQVFLAEDVAARPER